LGGTRAGLFVVARVREQAHRFDKFREVIMAFCGSCGTQMADNAAFCPNCGKAASQASGTGASAPPPPTPAPPASYGSIGAPSAPMEENIAGMLAYFTIIPAIIFLLIEPYNRNRFVRFHSFQSIFVWVAAIVIGFAYGLFSGVLIFVPFLRILLFPLAVLLNLAGFMLWLLLVIKAYQHLMFKLPIVGDMAEKQAGA
jgi:uncharacterized membrane protein